MGTNVVNQAFGLDLVVPKPPVSQVSSTEKTSNTSGWDAFEHILLFISLYAMATSITFILHLFIDKFVPGITPDSRMSYFSDFQNTLLRGYLATLIVSLPLFSFFFLDVIKRTAKYLKMRNLKSRKTLIYITLLVDL